MSRQIRVLFACLLLSSLYCSESVGEFLPRLFDARKASQPIVIDGQIDEPSWDTAHRIDEFYAYQSGGAPAVSETTARIMWDDDFLYVAFEMQDADIRPSSVTAGETGRDASLYLGDVIELFIREDRTEPRYFEFEWSPQAGDVFDARFDRQRFGSPGTDFDTNLISAVSVQGTIEDGTDVDTGWTVESAIPWSTFAPRSPDQPWTFTVARYDYFHPEHSQEQLMMSTPGDPTLPRAGFTSGFHTYEFYDDLQFVPEPAISPVVIVLLLAATLRRHASRQVRPEPQ